MNGGLSDESNWVRGASTWERCHRAQSRTGRDGQLGPCTRHGKVLARKTRVEILQCLEEDGSIVSPGHYSDLLGDLFD